MSAVRVLVDTNVVVRHLVQDQVAQGRAATRLFAASDAGEVTAVLLEPVVAECVFVLESFYRHPRSAVAAAMGQLLANAGVAVEAAGVMPQTLEAYATSGLHFVDCVLAATASATGTPVATFDSRLRRATGTAGWPWM